MVLWFCTRYLARLWDLEWGKGKGELERGRLGGGGLGGEGGGEEWVGLWGVGVRCKVWVVGCGEWGVGSG